ncbi:MAG: polyamine ABC transporter substrate-binding protein, partial [Deltaproteobacteria bacterium]
MLADMVFNGLLRYKPGHAPNFEPDLAEEIPEPFIVDGRQIWTFKLKRGIFFHAGPNTQSYEFTAADVVYSLNKAADPKRSAYAGEYTGMSVEKIDDYTCNIIMDPPLSPTLFFPKVADYAGG